MLQLKLLKLEIKIKLSKASLKKLNLFFISFNDSTGSKIQEIQHSNQKN